MWQKVGILQQFADLNLKLRPNISPSMNSLHPQNSSTEQTRFNHINLQIMTHDSSEEEYCLNKVECSLTLLKVTVNVNGMRSPMEVDTGAAVSIISDATCKAMFPALKIYRSNLLLKTYTGEQIPLVGNIHVHV